VLRLYQKLVKTVLNTAI